jgi:8-oxo-dGTP pyrophosphatase MutT (NUDIX family)
MRVSGDGWITCDEGHTHWGRYGAAGLLLRRIERGRDEVLLQLRVGWSHHGGTWGVPGGARDRDESALTGALREAAEEAAVPAAAIRPEGSYTDDHGRWCYTTVLASPVAEVAATPTGPESSDVRWVPVAEVEQLPLHPGFAGSWPLLRAVPPAPVLVVDGANTIGSRPDGWWRDRRGALERLRDQLAELVSVGIPDGELGVTGHRLGPVGAGPGGVAAGSDRLRVHPRVTLVAEGQARDVAGVEGVSVLAAAGSGDDAVVAAVTEAIASMPARPVLAVTADRELGDRVRAAGAAVAGPRWLLMRLP